MCDIDMYGHTFHSSEQVYQWKFTNYVGRHDLGEEILASTTPEKVKEIASRVPRHMQKDWHSIKIGVIEEVLSQKITSCDEFKNSLINSGNKRLVEAVKSDRYWSCGLNPKEASTTKSKYYPGENRFGLLLEHVGSTLIENLNTPKIVNHNVNLDTASTSDISSPQQEHILGLNHPHLLLIPHVLSRLPLFHQQLMPSNLIDRLVLAQRTVIHP